MVSKALEIRKRMQGITDQDLEASPSDNETPVSLSHHIDYLIGFIIKKSGSQFQEEISKILIS